MVQYKRLLNIEEKIKKRSHFLFGPRQTGKTTLLKQVFPSAPFYNLLHTDEFFRLSGEPKLLRLEVSALKNRNEPIIIDEIQKLPILLDEVHAMIEEFGSRFILTGSSPRKLRRGGYNLLGGRARTCYLHPLVSAEITDFKVERVLKYGAIPSIYLSDEPKEDLLAYCGTYLQQEIQAEAVVRNIENFSRFLKTAALQNTGIINFENVASDCAVPARTVREYFQILMDTLIGKIVEPFRKTKKRKPVSSGKFYFFDVGVSNILKGNTEILPKTEEYGKALENFIFTELDAYSSYNNDDREIRFWRARESYEVDFIIGDETAIEVKAADKITEKHCKGISALSEEICLKKSIIVYTGERPLKIGAVHAYPVKDFLALLWNGDI
jgi:uncharacterized protein